MVQYSAQELAIRQELWWRADLTFKVLPHQMDIWKKLHEVHSDPDCYLFDVVCHRGWGKSSVLWLFLHEYGLKHPGHVGRFYAPTLEDVRDIVENLLPELLEDCPEECMPQELGYKHQYKLPNGFKIYLEGSDAKQGNKSRGKKAHLAVLDEAAQMSRFKTLWRGSIFPTVQRTDGLAITITTPPTIPGHEYLEIQAECVAKGRHVEVDARTSGKYTEAELLVIADNTGGVESVDFQREYMLKIIGEPSKLIIPQWKTDKYSDVLPEHPHNIYYTKMVSVDWGWSDYTAALFGTYNYGDSTLYIQREIIFKDQPIAREIRRRIEEMEEDLWKDQPGRISRWMDTNEQRAGKEMSFAGLPIEKTSKQALEKMVGKVRTWVYDGRVKVDPSCENLIRCLETGTWVERKPESYARRQFGHVEGLGHLDALAALVYMVRNVPESTNPLPQDLGYDPAHTLLVQPIQPKRSTAAENAWKLVRLNERFLQ